MSIDSATKIQNLLQVWPSGTVATTGWLADLGISAQLLKRYTSSNWVKPLARSAYTKMGDQVTWQGGLYAMQTQNKLAIHAGALTAMALQGYAHYARFGRETVFLFSPLNTSLPAWFKHHDWAQTVQHHKTSFLPDQLGLTDYQTPLFSIKVSTAERAMLECLYLAPETVDLVECYQIMEGLTTLRPKLLQSLLEQCSSIKVKRLFLYMAHKASHDWLKRIDKERLGLGKGARAIVSGGVYIAEFDIIIPETLAKL
jgi:hypothetical protein